MNGSVEEHDPPSPQSETDSNISIDSSEFPDYFTERHGRLFHATPSPYYLPADHEELYRLDLQHEKLKALIGSNTFGPASQLLVDEPGQRKRVLDLGCGSGIWIREMAEQYSHVKFIGIDLFPAPGSSHPPSNAHFECYNMESYGLRIRDSTANLIHCRCIYSGLRDFRRLLREIHRVLRPNGLILSAEIDFYNNIPGVIVDSMPATRWVFERLRCYTQTKGLTLAFQPSNIRSMLELEGFTEIVTREVEIPLGNWMQEEVMRAIGSKAMEVAIGYMGSIRPAVLDAGGHTEGEIDARLQSAIGEIRDSHGITMNYILIHARKVA